MDKPHPLVLGTYGHRNEVRNLGADVVRDDTLKRRVGGSSGDTHGEETRAKLLVRSEIRSCDGEDNGVAGALCVKRNGGEVSQELLIVNMRRRTKEEDKVEAGDSALAINERSEDGKENKHDAGEEERERWVDPTEVNDTEHAASSKDALHSREHVASGGGRNGGVDARLLGDVEHGKGGDGDLGSDVELRDRWGGRGREERRVC